MHPLNNLSADECLQVGVLAYSHINWRYFCTEIMTAAFVVVVIGGLGSFWGVILAAVLVFNTANWLIRRISVAMYYTLQTFAEVQLYRNQANWSA